MASTAAPPRARPAHAPGPTFLSYTPSGRHLITAGANDSILVFETGSDGEPTHIDDCRDSNTAIVATNDFFVTGSEDGSVCKFSLESNSLDQVLVRCTLPIRDLALSQDKQWVAVASDELVVKVVNTSDMERVFYLRDHPKPAKHVSFDYSTSSPSLTVSGSDGMIYVYSLAEEQPELVKKIDGLIRSLETEDESSSRVVWHPDGRAFATATGTRDVQVMSKRDWERQRAFRDGHSSDITALAWSVNGALLVTASKDEKICLWETKSQRIIQRFEGGRGVIQAFSWHPTENILSYTNTNGELYIHTEFIAEREHRRLLEKSLQPAPFIHDPLSEISGNARQPNGLHGKHGPPPRVARRGTPDSLDDILGPDDHSDDGFLEDDDGAGYAEEGANSHRKRPLEDADGDEDFDYARKRRVTGSYFRPQIHESFQPGSTPWRGNRRYLCLNLLGCVWTVDQDTHHTVTVEFYDREFQRDFHFTDPFGYDKACLSEKGTLFASPPRANSPAMLYYRPHEHWTTDRPDWRTALPKGETATAVALSDSFVVVMTSKDYVRVFTLFGTPFRVYRQKSSPAVTCASWRDYVLLVGNGAVGGDGTTRLVYSILNVKRDEVCQSEDVVALPPGARLQSVFFSDAGDPFMYDSTGVLLALQHWRSPTQAVWTPLLDTTSLPRLASGRKTESYWPVAVSQDRFYCIILKGGDRHPYFPRPLLNDFDFKVPLTSPPEPKKKKKKKTSNGEDLDDTDDDPEQDSETQSLEQRFVLASTLHNLLADTASATRSTAEQRAALAQGTLDIDKTLLQLLAAECVAGEERGMKCLELVGLMRDRSGRMVEAAGKVAARFGRGVLREKIAEVEERRLLGGTGEEGENVEE